MANVVLGRGKLFFAPFPKGQDSGGIRQYLGNTPTLVMAQTNTKLDHFSAEGGLKIKDESIVLQSDMSLTFDADNISYGNLALWFGGNNTDALPSDAPSDMGNIGIIGRGDTIYGSLYFFADNPKGDNKNYWWPKVNLTPNGNFALKGDTWQTMSFTAEALKRDSSTERVYGYRSTAGASLAPTITDPAMTVENAAVAGAVFASVATLTAATPQVHAVPFNVVFTLDGGTEGNELAYLFVNDGTIVVTSTRTEAIGATGTVHMTIPSAGTVHVQAFANSAGTGTAIGTSGSVVAT